MKNFKTIFIITLVLDIVQFIPLFLALSGGEMKAFLVADIGVDGLAESAPGMAVLDMMLFVFAFIALGYLLSIIYALRLTNIDSKKTAAILLGIFHLTWALPDFINLISGSGGHPPIVLMIFCLIPIVGLFYVSQNGIAKSAE